MERGRGLPYEDSSQFGSHPALVGSTAEHGLLEPSWTTLGVSPGQLVVLASDALAEWLLTDPTRFAAVDADPLDDLVTRLADERAHGRIVNDDLTLAVMEVR